jgi:hypothetical protein
MLRDRNIHPVFSTFGEAVFTVAAILDSVGSESGMTDEARRQAERLLLGLAANDYD